MPRRLMNDLGGFVGGERIGKVPKSFLNVGAKIVSALIRNGNEAFSNVHGIHRAIVVDHHPLLGRFGVSSPREVRCISSAPSGLYLITL